MDPSRPEKDGGNQHVGSGLPDEVIDAVLNHVKKGVIAIYNRHGYDSEKQQALEAWERRLKRILTSEPAKVIPFRWEWASRED